MIDAHLHLWKKQQGRVNGLPVYDLGGGRSQFGAEIRQMLPPYMTDGVNSAERLIANMDFAQVAGAVVTQEYIDGNQDDYLRQVREIYPDRLRVSALYEERELPDVAGMDGIKKLKADNILTEDGVRTAEDKVQKLTDKYVKTVGDLVAAKEKEIMTV
jgi:predicted TIM-barrel fold metal-dependent hydrolase